MRLTKAKMSKIKDHVYTVRNIGNSFLFHIPSRHLRIATYKLFGGKIGKKSCFYRTTVFKFPKNIVIGGHTLDLEYTLHMPFF